MSRIIRSATLEVQEAALTPSADQSSASTTRTFVVMALGTVFNALTNHREPAANSPRPS
jgi:hypothetical protein